MDASSMNQDILAHYERVLQDLNTPSKVPINALTMLADDYKDCATLIVKCIEKHLNEVQPNKKLYTLYLIDSICKAFPNSIYTDLFRQNIVSNFCNVFRVSSEKVKKSLHKLRVTWEQNKMFPVQKLHAIDVRIHELDSAWPLPSTSARSSQRSTNNRSVNSKAASQLSAKQNIAVEQPWAIPANHQIGTLPHNNTTVLSHQSQGIIPQMDHIHNSQSVQLQNSPLQGMVMQPNMVQPSMEYIQPRMFLPNVATHLQPFDMSNQQPMDYGQIQGQSQQHLMSSHIQMPLQPDFAQAPGPSSQQIIVSDVQTPILSQPFSQQNVSSSHLSIIASLYGGNQCTNCSLRFDDNDIRYPAHLDWHFRENSKSDKRLPRRKWYYPLDLWVRFREIHDDDLQTDDNNLDNVVKDQLISIVNQDMSTATAFKDDEMNTCLVCHESFEKFWAEEEEEWQLKNAKLHTDGRVYHPPCLSDMLQANNTD